MFDIAMEQYKKWVSRTPKTASYKILQNGNGEFQVLEKLVSPDGHFNETHVIDVALRGCKSIEDCHEKMAELSRYRKNREFHQVWP
jgi:hypothetical protein